MNIFNFKQYRTNIFTINKRNSFTLAEVLITLGIIGIVASMTLPALIKNHQKKEIITGLKKSYAELDNISQEISYEYGEGVYNVIEGKTDSIEFMELFAKYYSGIKRCENNECANLAKPKYKTYLGASIITNHNVYFGVNQFITKDGRMYSFSSNPSNNGNGIYITVDVNGIGKSPNAWGRDVFTFKITEDNKVHPCGGPTICSNLYNFNCQANEPPTALYQGLGCTYYALTKPGFFDKKYYYENYTGEL